MMASARNTLVIGVLSTLSMDLLTGVGIWLRLVKPLPPNLIGRWFASIARLRPLHDDIARAAAVNHEFLFALVGHYTIGTVLAMLFVWGTGEAGWTRGIGVALAFGLSTSVLPWLLMFPAMGYGFFGVHGPDGTRLFVGSLVSHACFGLGLWTALRAVSVS
jgi:DUF2938 family protein